MTPPGFTHHFPSKSQSAVSLSHSHTITTRLGLRPYISRFSTLAWPMASLPLFCIRTTILSISVIRLWNLYVIFYQIYADWKLFKDNYYRVRINLKCYKPSPWNMEFWPQTQRLWFCSSMGCEYMLYWVTCKVGYPWWLVFSVFFYRNCILLQCPLNTPTNPTVVMGKNTTLFRKALNMLFA
jgi:hypothetical protein